MNNKKLKQTKSFSEHIPFLIFKFFLYTNCISFKESSDILIFEFCYFFSKNLLKKTSENFVIGSKSKKYLVPAIPNFQYFW